MDQSHRLCTGHIFYSQYFHINDDSLQYVYVLDYAARVFESFGLASEAAHYRELSSRIKEAVLKRCWSEERGLVAETPAKEKFSQHANVMAILVNLVPEEEQGEPANCYLHPKAAGVEQLRDGGYARVVSPCGEMRVRVRLDSGMRLDTCRVDQGGWLRFGRGVNALVADAPTDLGECTAFYDQRVRIEPCVP